MNGPISFKFKTSISLLAAAALFIAPVLRFSWDIGPQTVLHLLCLAMLLSAAGRNTFNLRSPLFLACLAFLGSVSLPLLFKANSSAVYQNLLVLSDCLIVALTAAVSGEEDRKTLLIIPVLLALTFSFMIVIASLLWRLGLYVNYPLIAEAIVNYNVLAGYLLLALPLSFIYWSDDSPTGYISSLVIMLAMALTGSRAATAIGAGALLLFQTVYFKGKRPKSYSAITALALITAAAAAFLGKNALSDSIAERLNWWQTALNIFFANPVIGIGWGNFADYAPAFRPAPGAASIYTHNIALQLLAETGLLGLTTFILIVIAFINDGVRKRLHTMYGQTVPLIISVSSFLLLNLFDYGFHIPALMLLFFFILGSLADLPHKPKETGDALRLGLGAVFLSAGFLASLPFLANLFYEKGLHYFETNNYTKAAYYLEKSSRLDKSNWRVYSKLAELYYTRYSAENTGNLIDAAVEAQRRAVSIFPESSRLYSDLAWLLMDKKDGSGALKAMRKAVLYDKFNANYKQSLAIIEKKAKNDYIKRS